MCSDLGQGCCMILIAWLNVQSISTVRFRRTVVSRRDQGNCTLPRSGSPVTPAEAGVQLYSLDSGFRRNDVTAQTSPDWRADRPPSRSCDYPTGGLRSFLDGRFKEMGQIFVSAPLICTLIYTLLSLDSHLARRVIHKDRKISRMSSHKLWRLA